MDKTRKELLVFSIILVFSTLACTSTIYSFLGFTEGFCKVFGGQWIPDKDPQNATYGECVKPSSGISIPEDLNSTPAGEISIETCLAQPDEYTWEFANTQEEARNDTKDVCWGDFILHNTSSRELNFKWFEYWDNGATQEIGWMNLSQHLAPGEEFSQKYETQTWSSGEETAATYNKLIVFNDLPECQVFLQDEKYQTRWDEFAVSLSDPCR